MLNGSHFWKSYVDHLSIDSEPYYKFFCEKCENRSIEYIEARKPNRGEFIKDVERFMRSKSDRLTYEDRIEFCDAEIDRFTRKWGKPDTIQYDDRPALKKAYVILRKKQDMKIGENLLVTIKTLNNDSPTTYNEESFKPSDIVEFKPIDRSRWSSQRKRRQKSRASFLRESGVGSHHCPLIPSIGNILLSIGVGDTYEHLVVAASTQVFFVLLVFHETDGITNSKQLAASVTLLDFFLIELCVDGAVNIVLYDKLSDFRADIVPVTLLLCLYQLQVCLTNLSSISLILSVYLVIDSCGRRIEIS